MVVSHVQVSEIIEDEPLRLNSNAPCQTTKRSQLASIKRQSTRVERVISLPSLLAIAGFLQDMSGQRLLQLVIVCEFLPN
jgi:hypothetical protein